MVIGITGGIGSGKSWVAECFLKFKNTLYYHADDEAKKLMNSSSEIRDQLIQEFGSETYQNNQLNRAFLSGIVFGNPDKLAKLNAIVHPAVKRHFAQFIERFDQEFLIIYENAILFEVKSDQVCDVVITVTAPKEVKVQRVMKRDKVSEKEVKQRMQQQWPDAKKILQSHYVIFNIDKEDTMLKVHDIHNILTKNISMI